MMRCLVCGYYRIIRDALYYRHEEIGESERERLCVPSALRGVLLKEIHASALGGHLGADKCYHTLRRHFYFPGMHSKVQRFVAECASCQRSKSRTWGSKGTPPVMPSIAPWPWHTVSIDFTCGLPKTHRGYNTILVVQDALSKRIRLIPCRDTANAHQTAHMFFQNVVRNHGMPLRVLSDNGPQFIAKFWRTLLSRCGSSTVFAPPYHPESNGSVERVNKVIVEMLRAFTNAQGTNWCDAIYACEFAYNSTVHSAHGFTPFFLDMGREVVIPAAMQSSHDVYQEPQSVQEFVRRHQNAIDAAKDALAQSRAKTADRHSLTRSYAPHTYAIGDRVWLSTAELAGVGKLSNPWIGPFVVTNVHTHSVELDLTGSNLHHKVSRLWHVSFVKPFVEGMITPQVRDEVVISQEQSKADAPVAVRRNGGIQRKTDQELGARVEADKGEGRVAGMDGGRRMAGDGGRGEEDRRREVRLSTHMRSELTPGSQRIVQQRMAWTTQTPEYEIELCDQHGTISRRWLTARTEIRKYRTEIDAFSRNQRMARAHMRAARTRPRAAGLPARG